MATARIPKTAMQAFEWLSKTGIEIKPAIASGEMFEFEYRNTLMFITTDTLDNELFVCVPIFLNEGNDDYNKEVFDMAEYMIRKELDGYIVQYAGGGISYVGYIYTRPKHTRRLRRYQLMQVLDEITEKYNTFLTATMVASTPFEEWLKEDSNKQEYE